MSTDHPRLQAVHWLDAQQASDITSRAVRGQPFVVYVVHDIAGKLSKQHVLLVASGASQTAKRDFATLINCHLHNTHPQDMNQLLNSTRLMNVAHTSLIKQMVL
jgi:hypothetical protein